MPQNYPNGLLAGLSDDDFALLRPHLKLVKLDKGAVLYATGEQVHHVYFPHSGVISLVVDLSSGEMIEAAMIGRDSIAGASSALDGQIALNSAIVQIQGEASSLDMVLFRKIADQSASLRSTLFRHEQALFAQAQQSVACGLSHPVEARLARWLLRSRDLTGKEVDFTQELLSHRLGVQRTSLSLVARTLQNAGLIRYGRGHIVIADPNGLREAACECYEVVKQTYDRLVNNTK